MMTGNKFKKSLTNCKMSKIIQDLLKDGHV